MELTSKQLARLQVLACYHAYTSALQASGLGDSSPEVRTARRALAQAIEAACEGDNDLLADFKRAFTARPSA